MQEFALNDTRVLLGRLVDADGVVCQVERNDKSTVDVLGYAGVESGCETQNLSAVIHGFEKVNLGLLWHKFVLLTKGILFVSESVVGRNLASDWLSWGTMDDLAERELVAVGPCIETLGEVVDSRDLVDSTIGVNVGVGGDLVAGQVVVTDEVLTGLVHVDAVGKFLTTKADREAVCAIVRIMAFADLKGVISEVIVHGVGLAI